jgi:type IX secretion system substrate protein/beta-propeller repeat-containing protein
MKKILFTLLLLSQFCFAQQYQWAKRAGGSTGDDAGNAICVDNAMNSYVTGSMDTVIRWHNDSTQAHHISHCYVSKYDPSGNILWSQNAAGINFTFGMKMAIDTSANLYVAGQFTDTAYLQHSFFGPDTIKGGTLTEIFIVSYDSTGAVRWINTAKGLNANLSVSGITVDAFGNTYVTGQFDGTAKFDTNTVYSSGNGDFYLAKYNSLGKVAWVKSGGANGVGVAFSSITSMIYLTGTYINTATFGNTTMTSNGNSLDIFVAAIDTSGSWIWATSAGGPWDDQVKAISADNSGNVFITGYLVPSSYAIFGNDTVNANTYDLFIAKYNSSGVVKWAESAGGAAVDDANSIINDNSGNIYLAGDFQGTATFGSNSFNAVGYDVFVSKYNSNGVVLGSTRAGGNSDDIANSIAVDNIGGLYITGTFKDTSKFGSIQLISAGGADMFIAKTGMNVGINEVKIADNSNFNVYPNPSTGTLTVNYSSKEITSLNVQLTNIEGEIIYSEQKQLNGIYNQNLDFSSLAKGIYFLEIITNKETLVKKIILN